MFTSIEEGKMALAATAAWGIYQNALEPFQSKMKECVHSLRNTYRHYRDAAMELKTSNIGQPVA